MVFGAETHVVWDKFANYFDVEMRKIPMKADRFVLSADDVEAHVDENTIAVGAVLGTTHIGEADPIEEINDLLVRIKAEKGWDIPLHVDGASGAFIAPFAEPDLRWDFRLEQVASINVSGHKYGLVYPGVGWLIFRDASKLPEDLVFSVNYLGGAQPTYTFNFSRGSAMIQAQMYNFLRLGRSGYTSIVETMLANARFLNESLEASGKFEILNPGLAEPVVTFTHQGRPGLRRLPPVGAAAGGRLDRAGVQPAARRRGGAPHARRRPARPEPHDDRAAAAGPVRRVGRARGGAAGAAAGRQARRVDVARARRRQEQGAHRPGASDASTVPRPARRAGGSCDTRGPAGLRHARGARAPGRHARSSGARGGTARGSGCGSAGVRGRGRAAPAR